MGFRDQFFAASRINSESAFNSQTLALGWRVDINSLQALRKLIKAAFQQGLDRVVNHQIDAPSTIQSELVIEARELKYLIEKFSQQTSDDPRDLAAAIQQMSDYLGCEFSQTRWIMERYTETSRAAFESLANSLNGEMQHYFEEGIRCFETSEYQFAKDRLIRVIDGNRTNYFAYQYLGFIAVAEDNAQSAIDNFKMARKFAASDYYQALAASHLAISHCALGEIARAAELADRCCQLSPTTAIFWYRSAKYCAQLERAADAVSALKNALKCDWNFWAVAIADINFDQVRYQIYSLLSKLRSAKKEQAQQALDNLKCAIDTAKKMGAGYNAAKCEATGAALAATVKDEDNIFISLAAIAQAEQWHEATFQIAERALKERLSDKRSMIAQQETNKSREIKDLDLPITKLTQEQKGLILNYSAWHAGCVTYLYLSFFSAIIVVGLTLLLMPAAIIKPQWNINFAGLAITIFFSIVIAGAMPAIYNAIRYNSRVTMPRKKIEQELKIKKREARAEKIKIEEDYKSAKIKIEEDLKELENLLELCRKKAYL